MFGSGRPGGSIPIGVNLVVRFTNNVAVILASGVKQRKLLRDPNRMMNFGTSFDVEMGVARKDRTHGQTLTTR